jgi:putative phosphoribosyl transferase
LTLWTNAGSSSIVDVATQGVLGVEAAEQAVARAARARPVRAAPELGTREVLLPIDGVSLAARLAIPARPHGLVLFAHGSGSSRRNPRDQELARALEWAGFATLLSDLLTEAEAARGDLRADVGRLARRVLGAARWASNEALPASLPLGYFGASTGAAAALIAAAEEPGLVTAVVSRGGRPDLADRWLPRVAAPTLFIVGANDSAVVHFNEQAAARLDGPRRLSLIPGAGFLFDEAGALAQVARLSSAWFLEHFESSAARDRADRR